MGSPRKELEYLYDSRGNRKALIDQDGGRFTYTYDAVNRITQVINPQGDRTSYTYDAAGRRTLKRMANGTRASFSYDPAGNLTGLYNLKSNGDVISSFDYQYDRVGNRTAVLEADGSRVTWSYDATYQLTGEHRTGATPYEDTYSYDQVGNRLTKVHDGARTTYSYDAANQLEWSEDASGRTTYTFDADGNQQVTLEPSGDRTTNTWDYENRMTRVELPSGIRNTMAYEPGGLRVKLEESTGTKKFVWDEQNYLAETDENDDTQVVYTNEPRMYGNLVSQKRGTDSHWYHFDAIGSTRELTNDSAIVTDTRLYDAWGKRLTFAGVTPSSFQYVGEKEYFCDTMFTMYVRNRYYSSDRARWLSFDPLFETLLTGGYIYASNSASNYIDPSGLVTCDIRPKRASYVPWCEVGKSVADFDLDTGREIPPDPSGLGLGLGIWGITDSLAYRISCICRCCNPTAWPSFLLHEVDCTVQAYFRIRIAPSNFPRSGKNRKGQPVTIDTVYAHEQLHLQNLIDCAKSACRHARLFVNAIGGCQHDCRATASKIEGKIQQLLDFCVQREIDHAHPHGPKEMELSYPVVGRRPLTSNCTAPGPVPPLPDDVP